MRKIFNEQYIVVFLFVTALVVFSLASEDARKIEARNFQAAGLKISTPSLVEQANTPAVDAAPVRN